MHHSQLTRLWKLNSHSYGSCLGIPAVCEYDQFKKPEREYKVKGAFQYCVWLYEKDNQGRNHSAQAPSTTGDSLSIYLSKLTLCVMLKLHRCHVTLASSMHFTQIQFLTIGKLQEFQFKYARQEPPNSPRSTSWCKVSKSRSGTE